MRGKSARHPDSAPECERGCRLHRDGKRGGQIPPPLAVARTRAGEAGRVKGGAGGDLDGRSPREGGLGGAAGWSGSGTCTLTGQQTDAFELSPACECDHYIYRMVHSDRGLYPY